jgi:hypothetical protein
MVINLDARRGLVVTVCLSDLEFAVTQGALLSSGIILSTCVPGDDVPVIEQKSEPSKKG